jgi:hypothetical protein
MLVLPMTAFCGHAIPTICFNQFDNIPNLHGSQSFANDDLRCIGTVALQKDFDKRVARRPRLKRNFERHALNRDDGAKALGDVFEAEVGGLELNSI